MTQNLRENIRVIVHVKKVWLAVRFNCKLAFILKNDFSQKLAETDSTFNLVRGQCQANETFYFEMPIDTLLAKCKKIKLFVTMISANGMVPAGFVTFQTHPTSSYEQFEQTLPLSRCDDPKAQIKFIHLYQNCAKTSIQNSYISQLTSKKDLALANNGDYLRGMNSNKTSYSVNRQNISIKKYKQRESTNYYPNNLSKISSEQSRVGSSGISPRKYGNIPRYSRINNGDSNLNSQQKNNESRWRGGEERINEERNDNNDSSMNQLSRDQLLKEHQEYWVEIVRMESEIQDIKQENIKIRQENYQIKNQNQRIREEYEADQEKIHAFVGEIQENADVIRKLQEEVKLNKITISQKEQFEKEYYKLVEILQEQQTADKKNYEDQIIKITNEKQEQRKNYENKFEAVEANAKGVEQTLKDTLKKLSEVEDQNSRLRQFIETSNSEDKLRLQTYVQELQVEKQKILFLQGQIKKYDSENSQLNDQITSQKQLNQFLQTSYQSQKIKASQLEKQLMQMQQLRAKIASLQFDLAIVKHEKQAGQQQLEELNKQYLSQIQLRDQFQNAFSSLQITKKDLEHQITSLNIQGDQYKLRINTLEKDLKIQIKQKDDVSVQNNSKAQQLIKLRFEIAQIKDDFQLLQLKVLQNQAVISSKKTKIEELTAENGHLSDYNKTLLQKHQGLQSEFELMSQCLKQEQSQKNQVCSLLSTIQDNSKETQDKFRNSQKKNEDLAEQLFKTQLQLRQQEQLYKSKDQFFENQTSKHQTKLLQLINLNEQLNLQNKILLQKQEGLQNQFQLMSQCLKRQQTQKEDANSLLVISSADLQQQSKAREQIAGKLQKVETQLQMARQQLLAKDQALIAESLKLKDKQAELQERLMELNQKNISISTDLERALAELSEMRERQNLSADQYQSSYNQSITSLSLKQSKLQKDNQEICKKIQTISKEKEELQLQIGQFQKEREQAQNNKLQIIKEKDAAQAIIDQLIIEKQQTKQIIELHQKQKQFIQRTIDQQQSQKEDLAKQLQQRLLQIGDLKTFTHNKLQEHLKLMREVGDLNKKLQNYQATINKVEELESLLRIKEKQIKDSTFNEKSLQIEKRELLQRNQQLMRQLKFATDVLQIERQNKSEIEKELADYHEKQPSPTEKQELPLINESSLIKEQSIGSDLKVQQGVLQIQSKMIAGSEESIPSQTKVEGAKKKKKKR